jgi:signal peptidase
MGEDKSFKAVLLIILILSGVLLTLTYTKNVYYVPSRSMEPTLMPGDLIIIKHITPEQLAQEFSKREEKPIIVFNSPKGLIVHRTYQVIYSEGQLVGFRTKGDNNPGPDAYIVKPEDVKGEVVFRIPLLGALIMLTKTRIGLTIISIILVILIVLNLVEFARWTSERRRKRE